MRCLGLDIGSTTIKGGVLDLDEGQITATVSRPFPAPVSGLPAGWVEIAPSAIVDQVEQVLGQLLETAGDATDLYCCGQMGGVILVGESGEPLTNYLSWRDQRTLQPSQSESYLSAVRSRWPDDVLESLGKELQPGSATSLLFWLAEQNSLGTGAVPASVTDFVISRLCRVSPHMHVTQAIGLLDLRTSDWHREAFERLGLGGLRLPRLSQRPEAIGCLTRAGRTLRVFGGYGDQQCALYGAGLQRGELSLNISTGSQVSLRVSGFQPGPYQTRKYFDGDWLNTVTHLPAGRSLNAMVDLLTELAREDGLALRDPWQSIIRKAGEISSNDLEVDLAFFAGPLGNSGRMGQITTENMTVGHLFHAAFRAMADNYTRCAGWLDTGRSWRSVVLSGGLTQTVPVLKSLILQRFDVPIRESLGEETLMGLLNLARAERASAPGVKE
ncbi:MAG: FGGY family carbohydrate kinase [Planctomycetaceae bacterium]|nr:FGGY family carbohydrate kinase [Planctomycetaceae bacterium]